MAYPVRPNFLAPPQAEDQKGAPQHQGTEQKGAPPAPVQPTPQNQTVRHYWLRPPAHPAAPAPVQPRPPAPAQPAAPAPVQAQPAAPAAGAPKRVPVGHKNG